MWDFWNNCCAPQGVFVPKLSVIEEIWADFRANGVDREIESPIPGNQLDQHKIIATKHMMTYGAEHIRWSRDEVANISTSSNLEIMQIGQFMYCVFCANNGSTEKWVYSHNIKDRHGRVTCPQLFNYVCPICGATRGAAHTVKYCPRKRIITMEETVRRNRK